jgi:hypothetical protein
MIARYDAQLLASLRFAGAPTAIPLQASHIDVTNKIDHVDIDTKVHVDHGTRGTPEHTDGMAVDPNQHQDTPERTEHTDVGDVEAATIPQPLRDPSGADAALTYRLDAMLGRLEDILLAREQQLNREVGERLDVFVSEITSIFSSLRAETAALERRLAAIEQRAKAN